MTRLSFAVNVGLARGERVVEPLELRVGGQAVPLLAATRTEREAVYVTEKLTPPHGEATVVFIAEQRFKRPQRVGIQLHRWTGAESLEPVGRRR